MARFLLLGAYYDCHSFCALQAISAQSDIVDTILDTILDKVTKANARVYADNELPLGNVHFVPVYERRSTPHFES
eukprot:6201857-Pleurochrysis_carterae.AAC.2